MDIAHLWLPIVLSGFVNHVLSTMFWMVSPHHKPEWRKLPDEEEFTDIVSYLEIPAGQYVFPLTYDQREMRSEAFLKKQAKCSGLLILWKKPPNVLLSIFQTVGYFFFTSFVIGYVTSLAALGIESTSMEVFRFVFTVTLLTFCFGKFPFVFWFRRKIILELVDGLIMAIATGAMFVYLWPTP